MSLDLEECSKMLVEERGFKGKGIYTNRLPHNVLLSREGKTEETSGWILKISESSA